MSKSIVMPYGIAIWSVRAYLRPIDPVLLSTRWETSRFVNEDAKRTKMFIMIFLRWFLIVMVQIRC